LTGAASEIEVRQARPRDASVVAPLLYEVAPGSWRRYTGSRARSIAVAAATLGRPGTDTSADVTLVAVRDGDVAGVLVGFPLSEMNGRQWRQLRIACEKLPLWRWPRTLLVFLRERGVMKETPADSYYVDALITARDHRRRGVARALLSAAEDRARARGVAWLALDTDVDNTKARALYESFGFVARAEEGPKHGEPGTVLYVKRPRGPTHR
jgi:ribosomal protein S18 acetylase RimI-like enzyme